MYDQSRGAAEIEVSVLCDGFYSLEEMSLRTHGFGGISRMAVANKRYIPCNVAPKRYTPGILPFKRYIPEYLPT